MDLFDVRSLASLGAAVTSLVVACGSATSNSATSDAGDAGNGESGTSRSCPMPTSVVVPGAVCTVDPTVTCHGPYGPAACAACELFALPCTCASGAWACDDQATLQCNQQRCPVDAGVEAGDAADAADQ